MSAMEESGRATPGIGGKPATPGPSSMPASSGRYGYQSSGATMHALYAPVPSGHVGHNNMSSHHQFNPSTSGYTSNLHHHQMHLGQQQQQGAQHGTTGNYMPPMPMMPPPSQYPNNKHMPHSTPGGAGQGPPGTPGSSQHVSYAMDRSAYYGSRSPLPGQQQAAYYQRPQMPPHSGKNFYPNGNGTAGLMYQNQPQSMSGTLIPGQQHSSHGLQNQPSSHTIGQLPMHLQHQQSMQQGNYLSHVANSSSEINMVNSPSIMSNASVNSNLKNQNGSLRGPQPPSILDEASQASTASSSLAAEDSCASSDMPIHKQSKHHHSHPPTPNTSNLGSPGAASLSSFHDEFDSLSSPSWPRTPASPAINNCHFDHSHHSKRADGLQKLYEMSDDPERRHFLDKLFQFLEERGTPLAQVPTISKIPVDLFRLYVSVKERGGFVEVTKSKIWKDCAQICGIPNSSSASYTLRKQYMKHLLPFECKFDRGGIDPGPVLAALEASNTSSRKKSNSAKSASGASTPNTPRLSPNDPGYPHSVASGANYELEQHGGPFPPAVPMPPYHAHGPPGSNAYPLSEYPYSGQAGSHTAHRLPPHSQLNHESVSIKDPFADEEVKTFANSHLRSQFSGDQNPYYGQGPPSSKSQSHSSNVPVSLAEGSFPGGAMHNQYAHYDSGRVPASGDGTNGPQQQSFPYGSYQHQQQQQQPPSNHVPPYDQPSAHYRAAYDQTGSRVVKSDSYTPPRSPASTVATSGTAFQPGRGSVYPSLSMHAISHQRLASPHTVLTQETYGKNHDTFNSTLSSTRMQSPLAQRLLAGKVPFSSAQVYGNAPYTSTMAMSGSTGTSTTPSSHSKHSATHPTSSNVSWMPSSVLRYPVPKRHPDFMKTSDHYGNSGQAYPGSSSFGSRQSSPINAGSNTATVCSRDNQRLPAPYTSPQGGAYPSGKDSWHDIRQTETNTLTGPDTQVPNHYPNRFSDYSNTLQYPGPPGINSKSMSASPMPCSSNRCESRSDYVPPAGQIGLKKTIVGNSGMPICSMPSGSAIYSTSVLCSRRESLFPPNTVEATVPIMSKRRKLTARDLSPVEAWRLYMCLKSGLLAESTYALDVLNIYSNDDSTLCYLSLSNMPGMLEVLIEHYRRYLNEMFSDFLSNTKIDDDDCQLDCNKEVEDKYRQMVTFWQNRQKMDCENKVSKRKWYELAKDIERQCEFAESDSDDDEEESSQIQPKHNSSEKIVLLNTTNYTNVTRYGKPVQTKKTKNHFIINYEKKWGQRQKGLDSSSDHWTKSDGETTCHILTHIEPKENFLRFVRVMRSNKKNENNQNGNDSLQFENGNKNGHCNSIHCDDTEQLEPEEKLRNEELQEFLQNEEEYPKIRHSDRERYWKRKHEPEYEEESYEQEETAVNTGHDYQDSLKSRCLTVSNLIRNLTFVPGNDVAMCRHAGLLLILSRLITLHHVHAHKRKRRISEIDCSTLSNGKLNEESLFNLIGDVSEKRGDDEEATREQDWWWDSLHIIRENTLVMLANLSGQLNLANCTEEVTLAILDGMLHWATCASAYAQDALPTAHPSLSPKRLAYETLSKLSILESNVDLILATPPWSRVEQFIAQLSRSLGRQEDQTMREFSIVLLSNFAAADGSIARAIALSGQTVSQLISFIEHAEQSALNIANTQGVHVFRENPELIGTTVDMIRRCACTLRELARVPQNRSVFIQHEPRLLLLSMSPMFDQHILGLLADVMYEFSRYSPLTNSPDTSIHAT